MDLTIWERIQSKLTLPALGKHIAIGLAALLVMVAVVAGSNVFDTATASTFEVSSPEDTSSSGASPSGQEDGSSASSAASSADDSQSGSAASQPSNTSNDGSTGVASTAGETIFVHVAGSVKKPGLVEVEQNARLATAIEAAGGFTKDALTDSVNLARVLSDGEQIFVASSDAEQQGANGATTGANASQTADGAVQPGTGYANAGASQGGAGGMVNINTAQAEELESLPGIGPATAEKIIADREQNGPFTSVDELTRVSGIGDKKLASIIDLICI